MEELAAAKELQRRSVLPFSAGSCEGAQDSCRRAQAKPSPRVLAVLFFLALISCCAEFIAIWTAATSFAGQSCSAQEDEGLLRRRANQAMAGYSDLGASAATLPWEVHSSADRGRQGGGEENPRKHRAHVAPCFRGLREDRGSESPQGISRRSCSQNLPRASQTLLLLFLRSSSCDRSGIPQTRLLAPRTSSLPSAAWSSRTRRKWKSRLLSASARLLWTTGSRMSNSWTPRQRQDSWSHRVALQVRLKIWLGFGKTPSSVRSIDGERSFQHVQVFPLPLRCLTPPLRLLSLMPLVCLTFILRLWMSFRKLRLEKPGPDLIPVELLKAGSSPLCLLLARLFSKVGDQRAPLAWKCGQNVPVPKKFDKPLTHSERGPSWQCHRQALGQDDQNGVGSTFCFAVLCAAAWSLLLEAAPISPRKQ